MMGQMRQNTKIILWVVVASFVVTIFAVWGLDLRTGKSTTDPAVIGKVNGVPITRGQYQSHYEALAGQFRAASDQPLTYSQEEFIANQAWDNMVYTILTDQEIQKLGITVSNDEIVSYLRNSPPPEIRQYFVDDKGNFDDNAYQTALNNPEIDWTNLEQLARERIPRLKLQNYLAAQVFVSIEEVRDEYLEENTEIEVAYVEFPIDEADAASYTPAQQEIETYYNTHRDEFKEPAKARIDVVKFDLKPSEADLEDAKYTIERVRDQVLAGEDIGALAQTYSEAPTSHVEGSTGFLKRGQRDNAYFDALDRLSPGGVSAAVAVENGYYLLKLVETKIEGGEKQYNAQEVLVKATTGRQTVDSLYTLANDLEARAADAGLDVAAKEKGYPMITTDPFTEGAPMGALGFAPVLNRFAFSNTVGTLSPVLRDERSLYVVRVVDRIPEGVRPLTDVTESIRHRLVFEAKKSAAQRDARAFSTKARASSFEEAAKVYSKTVKQPAPFKPAEDEAGFGPNSTVARAALVATPGDVLPPVEWRRSFVVARLVKKSPVDEAGFASAALQLADMLETRKIQAYTAYWYEAKRKESVIEDYRSRTY
jgi:peptidyl-prolyl cis-trans isomerase D